MLSLYYLPARFFNAFANLEIKREAVLALIVRFPFAFDKEDSALLNAFSASALSLFAIAARVFLISVRTAFKRVALIFSRLLFRLTRVFADFKFAIFSPLSLDNLFKRLL